MPDASMYGDLIHSCQGDALVGGQCRRGVRLVQVGVKPPESLGVSLLGADEVRKLHSVLGHLVGAAGEEPPAAADTRGSCPQGSVGPRLTSVRHKGKIRKDGRIEKRSDAASIAGEHGHGSYGGGTRLAAAARSSRRGRCGDRSDQGHEGHLPARSGTREAPEGQPV